MAARSSQAFVQEHIPGAINIPHRDMSPETTRHLDKQALVVAYCDGIGCNASTKGALNMTQVGFRVKELIGVCRHMISSLQFTEINRCPIP